MLLTIDVGNTEIKLGSFAGEGGEPEHVWRVTTEPRRTADEYGALFVQLFETRGVGANAIDAVAIASVVPKLDPILQAVCARSFGVSPLFLQPEAQTLMPVRTERPSEVGADLVAAAIGGRERFGAPLIVGSFGTATVFVAISGTGEYLGSAIAPGIATSIDALAERAAKLAQIAVEAPARAIGRTTAEALQSGIAYGFAGQAEAIVSRMRAEMGGDVKAVATGGLAHVVAQQTPLFEAVHPQLSLVGLSLFYRSQRG